MIGDESQQVHLNGGDAIRALLPAHYNQTCHDGDDPDGQEYRHQARAALAEVDAETLAAPPGRTGICRQRSAVPGHLSTAIKIIYFPRGKLK